MLQHQLEERLAELAATAAPHTWQKVRGGHDMLAVQHTHWRRYMRGYSTCLLYIIHCLVLRSQLESSGTHSMGS